MKKFISYRRVSTMKQGASGLGLEAQQEIINYFVDREGGIILQDFYEVHSGKNLDECAGLHKAIREAKKNGAILVIAKTDRFRNCQQALEVLDKMGENNLMFCDIPHTDRFTLTLFFALAERERLITSIRTKQALKAKKERGARLGSPLFVGVENESKQEREAREKKAEAIRQEAIKHAAKARREAANTDKHNIDAWYRIKGELTGKSLSELASILNNESYRTSRGGEFSKVTVKRLIERYQEGGAA